MSFAELYPGVDVRWEDDRPFEIRIAFPLTDPAILSVRERAAYLLRCAGWIVTLGPFEATDGASFATVLECAPVRP